MVKGRKGLPPSCKRGVRDVNLVRIGDEVDCPLMGCIAFGVIDRGTNLLQIRPTTLCPLSCIFCSTDAGPRSRSRLAEYVVALDPLLEWVDRVVEYKGREHIEAHIDTVGEPATYPRLIELIQGLADIEGIETISMQTNGVLLDEELIGEMAEAGMDRLNVSIHALDEETARRMAGEPSYPLRRILDLCEYIVDVGMDLLIAQVWLPGVNDDEMPRIIEYAKSIGAGRRWPPLGIQRYEPHKRGRRPRGVRPISWRRFYEELGEMERRYGVKLILRPEDFGIHPRRMYPIPYRRGETAKVRVIAPGWRRGEALAVGRGRAITIVGVRAVNIGEKMRVRIIGNKHNIILARPL